MFTEGQCSAHDSVDMAVEGREDGIADAVGRALAVGGLGEDFDVDAGPNQNVGAAGPRAAQWNSAADPKT